MKNRFCRMGKSLLGALCLLSTCGVTYSCSDNFDLDETKPSFLGASIYDELKGRQDRKFTTVIRLIDELGYQSVLSKTGSKTLFVADDDAYKQFFETTTWTDGTGAPVRSYEQLSTSQKRMLLNGSMLNNAYVLEMLTTIQGPVKNLCLRQLSSSTATDSVPYFKWEDLPNNLNKGQLNEAGKVVNADKRFWDKYRNPSTGGLYLALDKTEPMMTHFLEAQLNEKKITHGDVSFVLNLDGTDKEWTDADTENRSYVYGSEIVESDVTCLNGYYHVLDKVLLTPQNMAEMIRTNGETNYFSQILDRFSAPYYDAQLTEEYKALHSIEADSVFQKLYISQRSQKGNISLDPEGNTLGDFPSLSYDPGWNAYTVNSSTKEQDMGAMFVPSDEAMIQYFVHGGGAMLIERYSDKANTEENLSYNLYQIPLNIIKPLVANLMKDSFNETVPSKYLTIMNDAQDQMFAAQQYPTVASYKEQFKKVILANNGVIYVMNNVISPATYASVMAPALYNKEAQVMNTVIHADDAYVSTNYQNAPLRKFYSTYLLAMQSNFTLFVPVDEGLKKYGMVEPMGYASGNSGQFRYWNYVPEEVTAKDGKYVAVKAQAYRFNIKKPLDAENDSRLSVYSTANNKLTDEWGRVKKQMLTDMVDQHILVHEVSKEGEMGMKSGRQYFLSRSGAPVFLKKGETGKNGEGMVVDGGLQLQFAADEIPENDFDCEVTKGFDMTRATNEYGNGMTYFISRPMQATMNNTYKVLSETSQYNKFFELCNDLDGEAALIKTLFFEEGMDDADWNNELKKYMIFASRSDRPTASGTLLVRFFNNYRYSVYVPSNEAVQKALDAGLPTIEQIQEYVDANTNQETGALDSVARCKAQAMMACYVNFLKYHFCDQSMFVDNCNATNVSQSACSDESGNFINVTVNQTPNAMTLTDASGQNVKVQAPYNQIARDFELDKYGNGAREIRSSSYVAIHGLENYLLFSPELKNGFDAAWSTPAKAKAFVKQYSLKK